LIEEDAI